MFNKQDHNLKTLRTNLLYINSVQSCVILFTSAFLIVFLFYNVISKYEIFFLIIHVWFPFSLTVFALKMIITAAYHYVKNRNIDVWLRLFYITTGMSAFVFSSFLYFLNGIDNQIYRFFIVLLLGALSAGSVSTLSTSFTSFSIFNAVSLLPYSLYFIFISEGVYRIVGLLILLFLATIFITAYQINRVLTHSLIYSIENEKIIRELEESEEKFSKSFYSGIAPMAMINFDNAKFIDANEAMLNLIQYSRNEILGKTPYDLELYRKPEDAIDLIVEAYNNKHLSAREITLTRRDGKDIHCLVSVENFRVNNSFIALVMLQDFTKQIEYGKQLKLAKEKAESASQARTRFFATVSHEIRTPMNSILGMTNLALLTENREEREEYLNVVKDSADFLLMLINDILDLSRLETDNVKIELTDTDLKKFMKNVYHVMELIVKSKKLTFELDIDETLPDAIVTSPERLKQILINLIGNAVKFTSEGGITLKVRHHDGNGYDHAPEVSEFIEFSVTDTGIGIPGEKHESIFESFSQADPSTFRKYGGTGLGLAICKQTSKLLKGDITVDSEPGKGSRFSFIIPLIPGDRSCLDGEKAPIYKKDEKLNILFAEDNIMNQRLIQAYMNKLGHDFTIADNGLDALKILKQKKFDMVFLDLEMPEMNGYDAMIKIRSGETGRENSGLPIFAMSAHVLRETINKCINDGFTGYIIKPFDLKRLRDIF